MEVNNNWDEKLKKNQLKITKARIYILEELARTTQPLSAEDLHLSLRAQNISVDLSTIYRTLELFTEKKIVCRINIFEDGRKLFALHSEKHCHYLVCKKCKKILTIHSCPIALYTKNLEEKTGFSIDRHSLYLYGICKNCANKSKSGIVSEKE